MKIWKENDLSRCLVDKEKFINEVKLALIFPDEKLFTDIKLAICKDKVKVSLSDIDKWFEDRSSVHSKQIGRKLFGRKFVKVIQIYFDDNQKFFIKGKVAAEKTKRKEYWSKIVIDSFGHVQQCTCECPVGLGYSSSCKHSASILYAIENFISTGILHLWESCTSALQTWHRPSLVGRQAGFKTAIEMSGRTAQQSFTMKQKPNLECLKMLALNTQTPVALKSLVSKASIPAMLNEHDYGKEPFQKWYLENLNKITESEIIKVRDLTKRQSKAKLWWKLRATRLTGSMAGKIVKTVKNKNFAISYSTSILCPRAIKTPAIKWGNDHESVARRAYEVATGIKVKDIGFCIHKDFNFFGSSPDGITEDEQVILEIKCPFKIRDEHPSKAAHFTNNVPILDRNHDYYAQVQSHMFVTGIKRADFITWTNKGLIIENIVYDVKFVEDMMDNIKSYYENVFTDAFAQIL